jgi:lipopolysaccharide transport system ATP-binding protein
MSDTIISIENLSKRYLVGHQTMRRDHPTTLREMLVREASSFMRKTVDMVRGRPIVQGDEVEEFWALKNVSFEVKRGEAVGIIGRNGAGKSTLLKILSRITEPTEGRAKLRGRVASLLEVGTGFHGELTGRENIYLNGAILGMTRQEIRKKFDEIVAFAEVEKFLDTPVKRYSSGMYVRLAFAVAAHLEPEILVVDEVLAVGDADFQKKCLNKMGDASHREGKTVLFVTHNMEAMLKVCNNSIMLHEGRIVEIGSPAIVLSRYLRNELASGRTVDLRKSKRNGEARERVQLVEMALPENKTEWSFAFGEEISLTLRIYAQVPVSDVEIGIGLFSARGFEVASWTNTCIAQRLSLSPGSNILRMAYVKTLLLPGQYSLGIGVRSSRGFEDYIAHAVTFQVLPNERAAMINAHTFGGALIPEIQLTELN